MALAGTFSIMLNRNGKNKPASLLNYLRGKTESFTPVYDISYEVFINTPYQVG